MARKTYITHFTVEGEGYFPMDMLRYTASYPAEKDSIFMLSGAHQQQRSIRIGMTHVGVTPFVAEARWLSFGWKVSDLQTRPYPE